MEAHEVVLLTPHAGRAAGLRVGLVRALDILLAGSLLLVALPLLLAVLVAIRLDSPGPAFFRQRRLGRHRRPFTVHKFRTMHVDRDDGVHRDYVCRLIGGEEKRVSDGRRELYKLAVDDRITRVGRFLRSWSLDELPQLFDVLRGEMSLVGPRPVIPYEVERYPGWYHARFAVKPGLSGLWQISGRNERTYEEMVLLDIEYARRWSVRLYLSVLARTPWVVLARRGAA